MSFIVPDNKKIVETKIAIYDNIGNLVFETAQKNDKITWNLTNNAGRFVANGIYLVVAEIKDRNGNPYLYSAMVGVNR
jgi:hypothetical protein